MKGRILFFWYSMANFTFYHVSNHLLMIMSMILQYQNRRCVTEQECHEMPKPRQVVSDEMANFPWKPFKKDWECILHCPAGYLEVENNMRYNCKPCEGHYLFWILIVCKHRMRLHKHNKLLRLSQTVSSTDYCIVGRYRQGGGGSSRNSSSPRRWGTGLITIYFSSLRNLMDDRKRMW